MSAAEVRKIEEAERKERQKAQEKALQQLAQDNEAAAIAAVGVFYAHLNRLDFWKLTRL